MNSRICVCCGEAMGERSGSLSRNPNMCASCSSLADGMDDTGAARPTGPTLPPEPAPLKPEAADFEPPCIVPKAH